MKIIKLTEAQLKEYTNDVPFQYLSDGSDDVDQYSGNSSITATGKIEQDEYGNPLYNTTDEISDTLSSTSPYRIRYGYVRNIREDVVNKDADKDGIKDTYDNNVPGYGNTLDDGDPTTNTTVIPTSVLQKIDNLLNVINQSNLNIRQQYMVAAKILDVLNLEKLSPGLLKNLKLHLGSKK